MPEPITLNPQSQSLAEFDDSDYGLDSTEYLLRRRQAAQVAANDGLDGDPENAALADNLGRATGDNPQLIYSNIDEYQRQHKALLTSELLKNNETLREYALSHPLNATISNGDWGQLDTVSQAIKTFGKGNIIGHTIDAYKAIKDGWREGFGDEPIGATANPKDVEWWKINYPNVWQVFGADVMDIVKGGELLNRTWGGVMGALHQGLIQSQVNAGMDEQHATQRANDLIGMFEYNLMGVHHEVPEAMHGRMQEIAKYYEPWIEAGKHPPVPHPELQPIYAEEAKLNQKNLDTVIKETQQSSTLQDSRRAYEDFLNANHEIRDQVKDRMVGISPEGLDKVYPEGATPERGDGLLGDVPGIGRKIEVARANGGDVEVPLRDIVMADPDIYDELRDHIRSWPGAMTVEEAKAPAQPALAQESDRPPEMATVDAVRQAGGLGNLPEAREEWIRVGQGSDTKLLAPTTRWTEAEANIQQVVEDYFKKIAPQTETYFLSGARRVEIGGRDVQGAYVPGELRPAILYALHDPVGNFRLPDDILKTVRHEFMHYIWRNGFLSETEKDTLRASAKREDWLDKYDIHRRYPNASDELKLEEASAEHFGHWFTTPEATTKAREVFEKIKALLLGLREQIIQALGFDPAVNDLFHRIESGEVGAREPGRPTGGVVAQEEPKEPIEAKAMGITKGEQSKLLKLIAQEAERDAEFMRKTAERQERLRQTTEWKENEAKVKAESEKYIHNLPDIAADRFLREGHLYEGKVRRTRLDASLLTDEQKAALSPEHYGITGIRPDDAAGLFGYRSGNAMINALAELEAQRKMEDLTPNAHINRMRDVETQKRMEAQYGKLEENILAEAKEHALNPTTMDRLHEQMQAHGLKYGLKDDGGPITKDDVRRWAKQSMNETPVGEISSDKAWAEMGRLNRRIQKALLTDNDPTEAYKAMQEHYRQAKLADIALQYEKEREKSDRLVTRASKRVIPGSREEFTNFTHVLLKKGGVFVKRSEQDLAERLEKFDSGNDFRAFAERVDKVYGLPVNMSENMFDPNYKVEQDKMPLADWRDWSGAVKTMYNYGREINKFIREGDAKLWEDIKPDYIEQMKQEQFRKPTPYNPNKRGLKNLWAGFQHIAHKIVLMDSIWQRLDHGDPNGLFQTSFSYDAAEHVGTLGIWMRDFSKELEKIDWPIRELKQKVENSLFVHPRTREPIQMELENALKAISYMGTKTGEQKLIRGWILNSEYTKEQYEVARQNLYGWLENITKPEHIDNVQKLWDINEKIFDKYENMVTGAGAIPPEREELNPITLHGKTWKGGYVKLSYDPVVEGTSKKLMSLGWDPQDAMGGGGFFRGATTPRSHEKARTGYAGPLYLKFDRDNSQMTNVLRDAAIRPFIINASKAFLDNDFRDAVEMYLGHHIKTMMGTYLEKLAGVGARMSESDRWLDRLINYFSSNTIARLIGGNLHTVTKHGLSAGINSIGEVGPLRVAQEMRAMGDIGDLGAYVGDNKITNGEFAMKYSRELPNRLRMSGGTMAGQWDELQGKSTWRQWLAEKGAAPIGYFDMATAKPTWNAAFKDNVESQLKETGDFNMDRAISIADRAVRRAHGSTLASSRPEAMSGSALGRVFTRLYLFFNTMWQRNYEAFWRSKAMVGEFKEGNFTEGAKEGAIAFKMLLMANLAPALIEEMVSPYPSSDKDSWGLWSAKMLAMGMSGMIPGVREAVHAWVGGYQTSLGILDTGMKDMTSLFQDLKHGSSAFDAEHGGKTLKAMNSVIGTLKGYTNDQVGRMIKWGWDVTHPSKETPHSLYEHFEDITTGHPRAVKK